MEFFLALHSLKWNFFYADLVLVQIYEHPTSDDVFKYQPISLQFNDEKVNDTWRRPVDGRLKSLRLYKNARFGLFYGKHAIVFF